MHREVYFSVSLLFICNFKSPEGIEYVSEAQSKARFTFLTFLPPIRSTSTTTVILVSTAGCHTVFPFLSYE